jgi:hypothetical protein
MAEEKKEVKGPTFLQRLGRQLVGENPNVETPETEAQRYEKKTAALKAQDEFQRTREDINNPPSLREAQQKQIEEMQNRAKEAEQRARDAEDKAREADQTARKEAEAAAAAARDEARGAEKSLHDYQMQMLSQKLDEVLSSKQGLQQQMDEYFGFADQVAQKMGYQKPGMTTPASENPQIALEIAKMQIESAERQRAHEIQMEKDRREWDLKLKQMDMDNRFKERELELQEKRNEQIFSFPEVIGGAIAKGLIDRGAGQGGSQGGRIGGRGSAQSRPEEPYVRVGEGRGGSFECPSCHSEVGVGPTTTEAACVNCNRKFPVIRIPAHAGPPPPGTEAPGGEEEEQ